VDLREAIAAVLGDAEAPLHSKELTKRLLERGLWQSAGKTPDATIAARLYTDVKEKGAASRFVQSGKNTFALNPDAPAPPAPAVAPPAAASSASGTAARPSTTGGAPLKKRLSFTDATEDVLQRHANGQPMHYRDITKTVLAEDLVKTNGKTPEATLYAQIITENERAEKRGKPVRFIRHGKGLVGLAAWLEPVVPRPRPAIPC
jgi:restriction system protein